MNEPDTADTLRLLGRVHATFALYEHSCPAQAWFYTVCIALGIPPVIVEGRVGDEPMDGRDGVIWAVYRLTNSAQNVQPSSVPRTFLSALSDLATSADDILRTLPLKPVRNAPGGTT